MDIKKLSTVVFSENADTTGFSLWCFNFSLDMANLNLSRHHSALACGVSISVWRIKNNSVTAIVLWFEAELERLPEETNEVLRVRAEVDTPQAKALWCLLQVQSGPI